MLVRNYESLVVLEKVDEENRQEIVRPSSWVAAVDLRSTDDILFRWL